MATPPPWRGQRPSQERYGYGWIVEGILLALSVAWAGGQARGNQTMSAASTRLPWWNPHMETTGTTWKCKAVLPGGQERAASVLVDSGMT